VKSAAHSRFVDTKRWNWQRLIGPEVGLQHFAAQEIVRQPRWHPAYSLRLKSTSSKASLPLLVY
jgi:hypothetical protein